MSKHNYTVSQNKRHSNNLLRKLQDNDSIDKTINDDSKYARHQVKQTNSNLSASESKPASQQQCQQYQIKILKPIRQNTRTTMACHFDKENSEKKQIFEIPQPSDTSEAQSNEAKYLSHLSHYVQILVDKAKQNQKQEDFVSLQAKQQSEANSISNPAYHSAINIVYRCVLYLKKQMLITSIDDMLLHDDIRQHIQVKIHPQGRNQIGEILLRNGWFLAAYAIMMARVYASHFILRYLFNYFAKNFDLENWEENHVQAIINSQEFLFYKNRLDLTEIFKIADRSSQQLFTAPISAKNQENNENTKAQRDLLKKQNLKRRVIRQKTLGTVEELIEQRIAQKHDSSE